MGKGNNELLGWLRTKGKTKEDGGFCCFANDKGSLQLRKDVLLILLFVFEIKTVLQFKICPPPPPLDCFNSLNPPLVCIRNLRKGSKWKSCSKKCWEPICLNSQSNKIQEPQRTKTLTNWSYMLQTNQCWQAGPIVISVGLRNRNPFGTYVLHFREI